MAIDKSGKSRQTNCSYWLSYQQKVFILGLQNKTYVCLLCVFLKTPEKNSSLLIVKITKIVAKTTVLGFLRF